MAEITVDVGVRLNVLQSSITELERSLKNLKPEEAGFKNIQKIISNMRAEMEKLQIQTGKSFSSPQQFKQAGKTVEKLETSLARARLAVENIKFSDLKLDSNQQKAFEQVEQQIEDAESKFNDFQEKIKSGIIGNSAIQDGLQLIKTSDLQKSFDELDKIIDKSVATNTDKLADLREELAKIKEQEAKNIASRNILNEGVNKNTFADYDKYFNDYTRKYIDKNGQEFTKNFTRYKSGFGGENNQKVLEAIADSIGLSDAARQKFFTDLKGKSLEDINKFISSINSSDLTKAFKQNDLSAQSTQKSQEIGLLVEQLNQLKIAQAEFKNAQGDNGAFAPAMEQYNKVLGQCEQTLARLRGEAIQTFQDKAGLNGGNFDVMAGEVQNFTNQLNKANTAFLKLQSQQQTFNSMKMAIVNFMGFNQVLNLTKRAVSDAMNHIKQLDATMNGISIVTDMTTGDLWKQVDSYSAMAQKYGATIQGAYDVSKIYYQQGLDTVDVLKLTDETLKLSRISGLDYATTTDYMTTALRGFKMEMQDASIITDVYSALASSTAVSQQELAEAMTRTASSMESVGSTFQDTSAMIATMVAVTRESANNIGSAMKSIASRYGELTKDPAKLLDSEGEAMSFNKVDAALKSVGISMQTTDHQFRDFTDVIVELSEKWDTLDSTQQRYIATQFAGNRQQSRFLALISNGDLLKENMETAANSEDIGTLQALKALDSIEAKINQVQVAAQQFYTTIGAEGLWKTALDGALSFINTLNSFPKLFDKIPLGAITVIYDVISTIKTIAIAGLNEIAQHLKTTVNDINIGNKGQEIGNNLITNIITTIKGRTGELKNAVEEAVNTASNTYTELNQKRIEIGKQGTDRFLLGVGGNSIIDSTTGYNIDQTGLESIIEELQQIQMITPNIANELRSAFNSGNYDEVIQKLQTIYQESEKTGNSFINNFSTKAQAGFKTFAANSGKLGSNLQQLGSALNMVATLIDTSSRNGQKAAGTFMIMAGVIRAAGTALQYYQQVQTAVAAGQAASSVAIPWMAAAMAVITVINGIATAIETPQERLERLTKEAENLNNEAKKAKAEYNTLQRSINKLDELEQKRYDGAEAAEEYQTAVDELASKYPQLITGLDAAGNATIEAANLDYELEKARRAAAEATLTAAKAEREKAENELENARADVNDNKNKILGDDNRVLSRYYSANLTDVSTGKISFDKNILGTKKDIFRRESSNLEALGLKSGQEYSTQEILDMLYRHNDTLKNFISLSNNGLYEILDESGFSREIQELTGADKSSVAKFLNTIKSNPFNKENKFNVDDIQKISSDIAELNPISENFNQRVDELSTKISSAGMQSIFSDFMEYASELAIGLEKVENFKDVLKATEKTELSAAINNLGKEQQEFVESLGDASGVLTAYIYDLAEGKDIEEYIKTQLKGDYQQFQEAYKTISASNIKTEQFQDMWKNRQNYTAKDFYDRFGIDETDDPLGINAYYEQNMMDVKSLKTRLLQQMDQTSVDEEGIVTEFGQAGASLKTILKNTEEISPALANFASDAINQAQDYFEQGFVDKGTEVLNATSEVIKAVNKDGVDSGAINALIKQYGISNIDSISNIIENIPEGTDSDVETAFKALQDALLYNLPLAIQAYTNDLTSNIEGYESKIKKTSSGMSVSEAMEALDLVNAKRGDNEQFHLTNFDNKNGKLTMQSDLRQQYAKAIVDDLNSQYEEIETKISEFIGKDNKPGEHTNELQRLTTQDSSLKDNISSDTLNLLSDLQIIDKDAYGNWHYVEDMIKDTTSIFDLVSELLTQQSANALELREYAAKQIPASAALEAGDVQGYFKELLGTEENVDLKKIAGGNFEGFELPYEQMKAGKDKINEIYDQFISDIFSKGIENIDLRDYEGIYKQADDETKKAIQAALDSGNYQEIVKLTAELAGKTVQQTNDLVIQAIEASASYKKEIASSDVIKDINFLTSNIAYATLDTINALADNLGIEDVNTLFDINSFDAALGGYKLNMEVLTANGLDKIVNSSNIVADSIKNFLDSLADGIGKGLEGKLDYAGRDNLIASLGQLGINLEETDFTKTADGLKMARSAAIEVYNELEKIDKIKAELVFDNIYKDLTSGMEGFSSMSDTMVQVDEIQQKIGKNLQKIVDLQKASGDNSAKIKAIEDENAELEKQLHLYEQIAHRQMGDASSYDFMSGKLPEGMQGPANYWNSVGKAYKTMNEAAKNKNMMDITDYYNIVNEMSNLAALSGNLTDGTRTFASAAEMSATLIEDGMSALTNIDGEGVKVNLSKIGVDFLGGAESMQGNFQAGIKSMAKSQIAMLDAAIQMLETIVAMEQISDIDVDGNGIEFDELFDQFWDPETHQYITKWDANAQSIINDLITAGEKNPELKAAFESFYLGGYSFWELLKNENQELTKIGKEGQQALVEAFNIINDLTNSDDWDPANIDKIYQKLEESGLQDIFSQHVFNKEANMSLLITPNLYAEIDWDNVSTEQLADAGFTGKAAEENAKKFLDNYARGKGTGKNDVITIEDTITVLKLAGKVKVNEDDTFTWTDDKGTSHNFDTEEEMKAAIQAAQDYDGYYAGKTENGEIIIESTIGERNIKKVITEEGTKYEFDDGFTCIAENDSDAVHQYYVAKQTEKYGDNQDNWEDEKAFTYKEKLNVIKKSDIKFVDGSANGGDGLTPQEQAEEIRKHSVEEINEKLNDPNIDNGDGTVTIELGGKEITIEGTYEGLQGKGQEVADKAAEELGIDVALSKTIVDAIQKAFQGEAGSKIGQAIKDGIATAFGQGGENGVGEQAIPIDNINVKPTKITIDATSSQKELNYGEDNTSISIPAITVGPAGIIINTGTIPPTLDKTDFTITGITVTGEQVPITINSTGVVTPYTEPVIVPMLNASGIPLLFTINPDGSVTTIEPGTTITGLMGFDAEGTAGTITVTIDSSTSGSISETSGKPDVGTVDATATSASVEAQSYTVSFTSEDGKTTNVVKVFGIAQLQGVLAQYGAGFIDGTSNVSGDLILTVPTPDVNVTTNAAKESLDNFRQGQESTPLKLSYIFSPQNENKGWNGTYLSNSRAKATTIARNWEGSNKKKGDKKNAINDIKDNEAAIVDYVQQVQAAVKAGESLSDIDYNNILSLKEILGNNTSGGFLDQFSTTADKILSLSDANKSDSLTPLKDLVESFSNLEIGDLPQIAIALSNIAIAAERLNEISWDTIAEGIRKVADANSGTTGNDNPGGNTDSTQTNGALQEKLAKVKLEVEKVEASNSTVDAKNASNVVVETTTPTINASSVNLTASTVTIGSTSSTDNGGNDGTTGGKRTENESVAAPAEQQVGVTLDVSQFTNSVSQIQTAINNIKADPITQTQSTITNAISTMSTKFSATASKINSIASKISSIGNIEKKVTLKYATQKTTAAKGTFGGASFAKGNRTLMGELGPEMVVSNGHYYVVGENGAEFVDLEKDAIVFNHRQTKKLLSNGAIGSRGKPTTNETNAISFAKGGKFGRALEGGLPSDNTAPTEKLVEEIITSVSVTPSSDTFNLFSKAKGDVSGPAFASASAALAQLKQIRAMWQSMLDASAKDLGSQAGRGGGGGGGGGGGDDKNPDTTTTADIQRWYNWLRQIEHIEMHITEQEKLQNKYESDRIANGELIYKTQKDRLKLLDQEIVRNQKLADLQKSWYDNKRKELAESSYGKIFTYDEYGLQQYVGDDSPGSGVGLDILENLTRRDVNGKAIDNAETSKKQLQYLKSVGFNINDLLYNDDGTVIAKAIKSNMKFSSKTDKKAKDNDLYTQMMENFWNNVDAWRDELDSLYDSYHEQLEKVIENQTKQNELIQAMVDNELSVEQDLLKAIEDREQAEIDRLQDQRDALEDASQSFLDGLNDQLSKEREMYEKNQQKDELTKLQRQLAILQRSGGSASQIRSLQDQISSKQQDAYFNAQQEQIDAIQEASDKQIERLDTQIDIMTQNLEYQKEHGLLWQEVRELMKKAPSAVAEKMLAWSSDYQANSILQNEEDLRDFTERYQQYEGFRNDKNADEDLWTQITDEQNSNKEYADYLNKSNTYLEDTVTVAHEERAKAAGLAAYHEAYDAAIKEGKTEEEAVTAGKEAAIKARNDTMATLVNSSITSSKKYQDEQNAAKTGFNNWVTNEEMHQKINGSSYYGLLDDDNKEDFETAFLKAYSEGKSAQESVAAAKQAIDNKLAFIPDNNLTYYTYNKSKKKMVSGGQIAGDGERSYTIIGEKTVKKKKYFLLDEINGYVPASAVPGSAAISNVLKTNGIDVENETTFGKGGEEFQNFLNTGFDVSLPKGTTLSGDTSYQTVDETGKIINHALSKKKKLIGDGKYHISDISGIKPTGDFSSITLDGFINNGIKNPLATKRTISAANLKKVKVNDQLVYNIIKAELEKNLNENGARKFKAGGIADFTGPAWLDGTSSAPEAVLNASQTKFLREDMLGNSKTSLISIVSALQDAINNTAAGTTSTSSVDDSVVIENVSVTFEAGTIANDYDARRAGTLFKEELIKIARKSGSKNITRR